MIELRLVLQSDASEAGRLRALLDREGFRVMEAPPPAPEAAPTVRILAEEGQNGGEDAQRRIEELEVQLRELRNLDVAKSQFLANVSHELRRRRQSRR